MRVEIAPTVAEDVACLIDEALPQRIKALTVKRGDEVLGIGGLTFLPNGTVAAFVSMKDGAARKYPIMAHRAALRTMAEARSAGYRRIVATADQDNPAATRWLERLGFHPIDVDGTPIWVWEA